MAKLSRHLALAGALVAMGTVSAQAQSIVVRSTGPTAPQHPRGQRLPQGATLTLRAADIITVLDRSGTRVLRGPGTYRLDGAVVRDNGVTARLARSLSLGGTDRTLRAGAVRGLERPGAVAAPQVDTIWLADVGRGGNVCVLRGSTAYLWRDGAEAPRTGSLSGADRPAAIAVTWPARSATAAWPVATLPLSDGSAYRYSDGSGASVDFRIVLLDPATLPADPAELGALLLARGCAAQFDRLADRLAR